MAKLHQDVVFSALSLPKTSSFACGMFLSICMKLSISVKGKAQQGSRYVDAPASLAVNSFYDCIDACAKNAQCVDVALSGSQCYLKSSVGAPVQNGVWGAKLIMSGPSSTTTGVSTASP